MGSKAAIVIGFLAIGCSSIMSISSLAGGGFYYFSNTSNTSTTSGSTDRNVTIAGETFNPTGYTVSRGYIWNRQPLTGYTPSAASASECRQRCQTNTNCLHFGRRQTDGMCYLHETDNSGDEATGIKSDDVHVRGIKNSGTNQWSSPVNLGIYYDGATQTPPVKNTLAECMTKCTSNTSCIAFSYRTDGHVWSDGKKTCLLYNNNSNPDKYEEGFMNR